MGAEGPTAADARAPRSRLLPAIAETVGVVEAIVGAARDVHGKLAFQVSWACADGMQETNWEPYD